MPARSPFQSRRCAPLSALLALAVLIGCDGRTKSNFPRNPQEMVDLYDTIVPLQKDAGQFVERMKDRMSQLQGIFEGVFTAPEWNVRIEATRQQKVQKGEEPDATRIVRGSRLQIDVIQDPKLSRSYLVGPDGYVDFLQVGRVKVEGLTVVELKDRLKEKLATLIRAPEVSINFETIASPTTGILGGQTLPEAGRVLVFGEIQGGPGLNGSGAGISGAGPGKVVSSGIRGAQFPFTGRERLSDVLAAAGGTAPTAAWNQVVVYRKTDAGKTIAIFSDFSKFLHFGDLAQDFPVANGDVVYVPMAYPFWEDKLRDAVRYLIGWMGDANSIDDFVHRWEGRRR